jgi:hypothetical protein
MFGAHDVEIETIYMNSSRFLGRRAAFAMRISTKDAIVSNIRFTYCRELRRIEGDITSRRGEYYVQRGATSAFALSRGKGMKDSYKQLVDYPGRRRIRKLHIDDGFVCVPCR